MTFPDEERWARLEAGEVGARLAEEFGVSGPTISSIKVRRNWTHL